MFPYFLHKFGGIWLHDGSWSQNKGNVDRETRLSPKHEEVGLNPMAEFQVQLYALTNIPMSFFHS